MKPLSVAAALLFILLSACATGTPGPPEPVEEPPETQPTVSPQKQLFDRVVLNITICSPRSLDTALDLLEGTEAGSSEYGQELRYLAVTLADILYPAVAAEMPSVPPPASGVYPQLFNTVRTGKYPLVPQEAASFLTLIIPPMACLFTSAPEVLEQCSEALRQAESLETRSVVPPYLLGVIGEKRKEWNEAMDYYTRALETDDSCYVADLGWARAALQQGRVEDALERLEVLAERFPDDAAIMYLRAYGNYLRQDYNGALEILTDALRATPDNTTYLLLRAKILEAQGNVDQARRILSIVETKMPENEEIAYLRGKILFGQERFAEAAEDLEASMESYPSSERLQELYGEVLIAAGRSDEARAYLREKLEDDPENLRSLELLAKEARDAGEWEQAAGYVERLLEIDIKNDYVRLAAEVFSALDDWEKTHTYAGQLYEEEEYDGKTVLLYLESLIKTGRTDRAETVAREALATETDSVIRSTLYYHLSRVLDDRTARLDALRSALLENLHNIDALVALAGLYAEAGDYRKAYRYINQAYMLEPDNPTIRAELRRIEELAQ